MIIVNPEILSGKPHIEGTRLSVEHIASLLQRWPDEQILHNYPRLKKEDIEEVRRYVYDLPS